MNNYGSLKTPNSWNASLSFVTYYHNINIWKKGLWSSDMLNVKIQEMFWIYTPWTLYKVLRFAITQGR